ncbi:MAG: pilus (MSHA type) biogenesis protein MshL [Deltaproteobacteria bacterium RIFOXYD12_FULL_57_12]|nr:MAG: pilus (MSHA type) biogenesis protein MshL [Deltaproteobacteria bacterium RIFOXYD12_FULL_57_12]
MHTNRVLLLVGSMFTLLFMLMACAPLSSTSGGGTTVATGGTAPGQGVEQALPVRFQRPSYVVKSLDAGDKMAGEEEEAVLKVGANISSQVPLALREVIKILVEQKNMTVSWASDVDQNILVDVNIGAEDGFYQALDNLLRQVDYYHDVQGNTLVIRYNETRKFHVSMPFMTSTYDTSVGGNVLGGSTASNKILSEKNTFDIWKNIQDNLNKVLDIQSKIEVVASTPAAPAGEAAAASEAPPPAATARTPAKGYYTIDRPIGLITVTAPRPLQEKIATYFDNLKGELYKQISIEAKIIEVTLTDETTTGIDWKDLLTGQAVTFNMFGGNKTTDGTLYPHTQPVLASIKGLGSFDAILHLLKTKGRTKVLSNPRIVTMNGQPAMISVGQNLTYIAKVETTITDGTASTTVTPEKVFSGLGLGVVPMISENDEIIISLTPVITALKDDKIETFEYAAGSFLGVPIVNIREMNSIARMKNGEMLLVGGFIKESDSVTDEGFPGLGDVPVIGNLFKKSTKTRPKTELVIMLRPTIM